MRAPLSLLIQLTQLRSRAAKAAAGRASALCRRVESGFRAVDVELRNLEGHLDNDQFANAGAAALARRQSVVKALQQRARERELMLTRTLAAAQRDEATALAALREADRTAAKLAYIDGVTARQAARVRERREETASQRDGLVFQGEITSARLSWS